jgi:hypothetical protein
MYVHNRLYLALISPEQAGGIIQDEPSARFLLAPLSSLKKCEIENSASFAPSTLAEIYRFDEAARAQQRRHPCMKIVFPTGPHRTAQVKTAFMLGCHMIMSHGCGFEETFLAFKNVGQIFGESDIADNEVSVKSCWRAMCQAKCRNWIDFTMSEFSGRDHCQDSYIDMDEHMHYAR